MLGPTNVFAYTKFMNFHALLKACNLQTKHVKDTVQLPQKLKDFKSRFLNEAYVYLANLEITDWTSPGDVDSCFKCLEIYKRSKSFLEWAKENAEIVEELEKVLGIDQRTPNITGDSIVIGCLYWLMLGSNSPNAN